MKDKYSNVKINNHSTPYLITLSLALGVGIGALLGSGLQSPFISGTPVSKPVSTNLDNIDNKFFNEVSKVIQENYIGELPSSKELTYGALKGMLSSLGNEYNSFLTPTEAESYLQSRNPNIEGIGVTLRFNGENTVVETVLSNYPAEKAGLKTGDIVLEVNGESVSGKIPSSVASKIRGESGTEVVIKVGRTDSEQLIQEFKIVRQRIELENIDYKSLGNGIYKINIYQFLDTSAEEFNRKWDNIVNQISRGGEIRGLIIDLRNNPGGYVYSVRYVLEEFLSSGQIMMSEQLKNKPKNDFLDKRVGRFENIPITVLVNEGSASASEIFASAIQDNNRGEVIGKRTVGKGVEQQVMTLDDKSMLILVFQKWLTPSGKNIDPENPIIPDYEVDLTELDANSGKDPQLDKAKEFLEK